MNNAKENSSSLDILFHTPSQNIEHQCAIILTDNNDESIDSLFSLVCALNSLVDSDVNYSLVDES